MKEDNVIKFKNKNKITDSEINGLFLGLVRLVKKIAMEEASERLDPKSKSLFFEVQSLSLLISQREREIEKLKEENNSLKNKIKVKNLRILQLSCNSAKRLSDCKLQQKAWRRKKKKNQINSFFSFLIMIKCFWWR